MKTQCRCGKVHTGENADALYRFHACFHEELVVTGMSPDGKFIVYCAECETAWLARCEAEGMAVSITNEGIGKGCKLCQDYVLKLISEGHPDEIDYTCPDCGERWKMTRGETEIVKEGSDAVN